MAKKKRRGGPSSGGKIPLESAVDSDGEGRAGRAWTDDMDEAEQAEVDSLSRSINNKRRRSKNNSYGEEAVVMPIDDSDSDTDVEEQIRKRRKAEKKAAAKKNKNKKDDDDDFASDLDDGDGEVRYEDDLIGGEGWGKKKKHFYGGNPNERRTNDGEKVDEEEDEALIEAKESKKLQTKQLEAMDEGDFLDAFDVDVSSSKAKDNKDKKKDKVGGEAIKADLSQLSRKERARLFQKESPEFAGVMEELDARMAEAADKLAPVVRMMDEGKLPSEGRAAQVIRTKYQIVLKYV